jgi:hypothetical protein
MIASWRASVRSEIGRPGGTAAGTVRLAGLGGRPCGRVMTRALNAGSRASGPTRPSYPVG